MSTQFQREAKISWYRSPIDSRVLAELMERDDFKGWRQTILHLGLFFLTCGISAYIWGEIDQSNWIWMSPLLIVVLFIHGTMGPFMGLVAVHELQHRTVFRQKSLNEFFEVIYAFISWSDYIWYQQSHAIHHRATCHLRYDGEVQLPLKFSYKRWRFWLGMLAWNPAEIWTRIKLVWNHANGRVGGNWYEFVLPEHDAKLRLRHRRWARILLTGHMGLAVLFILIGEPFLIVVFTFGTFYCRWLGFLCGLPQHYGLNSNEPDFRVNTRTFTCSWLPAFYYWNMQYHLEHHMYPAVPFHNLPKLREALAFDLPIAKHGLYQTWKEILSIRKNILADPTYKFVPEISWINSEQL